MPFHTESCTIKPQKRSICVDAHFTIKPCPPSSPASPPRYAVLWHKTLWISSARRLSRESKNYCPSRAPKLLTAINPNKTHHCSEIIFERGGNFGPTSAVSLASFWVSPRSSSGAVPFTAHAKGSSHVSTPAGSWSAAYRSSTFLGATTNDALLHWRLLLTPCLTTGSVTCHDKPRVPIHPSTAIKL